MADSQLSNSDILQRITTVYPDEELRHTFRQLAGMNINVPKGKIIESETNLGYSHTGNICSNHFFLKHRVNARCGRKPTLFEWVAKKGLTVWGEKVVNDNKNNPRKPNLEDAIPSDWLSTVSKQVGKIPNQFKPRIASVMMEIFKPTSVLDFSAGWGDRCIGVCAKNINYIGIDSNVDLEPTYREMSAFYGITPTMIFQPSETVDFSRYNYDMVFTSPPYYIQEVYQNMPQYASYEVWVDNFLKVVLRNSMLYMQDGGWMCLNIPSVAVRSENYPIYESVVGILGKEHKAIRMNLQSQTVGKENYEYIYCWKKGQVSPTVSSLRIPLPPPPSPASIVEDEKEVEQQIVLDITNKSYSIEVKNGKLIIKIK
jgi:hypothetical protein